MEHILQIINFFPRYVCLLLLIFFDAFELGTCGIIQWYEINVIFEFEIFSLQAHELVDEPIQIVQIISCTQFIKKLPQKRNIRRFLDIFSGILNIRFQRLYFVEIAD